MAASHSSIPDSGHEEHDEVSADASGNAKLPPTLRRLFFLAPPVAFATQLPTGIMQYFPAVQAQLASPENKVAIVATFGTLLAVVSIIAQPLVGSMSDRTRSRWGSRKPWMFIGLCVGSVALLCAGFSTNMVVLGIALVVATLGYTTVNTPFTAILPDRVPNRFRGRYSSFVALGMLLAAAATPQIGAGFITDVSAGYVVATLVIAVAVLPFLLVIPGGDNRTVPRTEGLGVRGFLEGLWVSPTEHPDFFWGFVNRALLFGAIALPTSYQLYILQDYIGLSLADAGQITKVNGLLSLPVILVVSIAVGPLTDRLGRRKPAVLLAGLGIVVGAVLPLVSATTTAFVLSSVMMAASAAAYMAVDPALMSQILPNKMSYGKDLGVLNLAATIPSVIAPSAAGFIVTMFGTYAALYPFVALIGLAGALSILRIRGAR